MVLKKGSAGTPPQCRAWESSALEEPNVILMLAWVDPFYSKHHPSTNSPGLTASASAGSQLEMQNQNLDVNKISGNSMCIKIWEALEHCFTALNLN